MLTKKKVIPNGIYKIFKTPVCIMFSVRVHTQWTKLYAGFARRTRGNDQKITQSARFRACIWVYVCRRTRAQSRVRMWMLKTPWSIACAAPRITPGHLAWKISGVHSRGCTGGSRVLYLRARAQTHKRQWTVHEVGEITAFSSSPSNSSWRTRRRGV